MQGAAAEMQASYGVTPAAAGDSTAAVNTSASPGWGLLLQLPPDLLVNHVLLPHLSIRDKAALRQASRLCQRLVNAAVGCCVLDTYHDNAHAGQQLPRSFVNLGTLRIACTPHTQTPAAGVAASKPPQAAASGRDGLCSSNIQVLQQQLPHILQQLPHLRQLVYEGPRDRRQQGMDMTAALQALAAAAAAAAGHEHAQAPPARPAAATPAGSAEPAPAAAAGAAGSAAAGSLRVLSLTSGSLPDALMESVGRLRGLSELKLNATAAICMGPVAQLTALTGLTLTVTPPLPAALWPLSRLSRLQALTLSALSPARGWGSALARLGPCCPLACLVLTFADIDDGDMAAVGAALTQLTYVNINYSRHLTPASVPHLARLSSLSALHLQETGLTLGPKELAVLGSGCSKLHTLEAAFDLRGAMSQPLMSQLTPMPQAFHLLAPLGPTDGVEFEAELLSRATLQDPHGLSASVDSNGCIPTSSSSNSGWPGLRRLMLNGVSVADFHKLMSGFRDLTSLVLDSMGPNGNSMLLHLTHHGPQPPPPLRELVLSAGGPLSEVVCEGLGLRLPHLQSITLSGLNLSASQAAALLGAVLAHRASLQTLVLHKFLWLGQNGGQDCTSPAAAVLSSSPDTTAAVNAAPRGVGVDGVDGGRGAGGSVLGELRELRRLELSQCALTSNQLLGLADRLPRLTRLVVGECAGVGPGIDRQWEAAVAAAARAHPRLPWAARQVVIIEPCASEVAL